MDVDNSFTALEDMGGNDNEFASLIDEIEGGKPTSTNKNNLSGSSAKGNGKHQGAIR